ncbi:MAG: UDP-N-acetylmuramoyl-L-alanine--D-glutamate ligase [Crocinitomicaceae bacterium]|nr:UDP-N-acetylmuramoyl-L-alanine--D-glutamate ligase [Crocinitomicaceae bacterium]
MVKQLVALGAGESGVGTALLAKSKGFEVLVSDAGKIKKKYENVLSHQGIEFEENKHSKERILESNIIVKSPGIPDTAPLVVECRKKGIEVIGEIEFASRYFNGQLVGITGSNGKTTTTSLAYHLLSKGGLNPMLGGNIGESFARQVIDKTDGVAVLELSSFQLDDINSFRPNIAIILNITPDHLDRYDYKMENYIASKFRITKYQSEEDFLVYNADDENITNGLKQFPIKAQLIPISIYKKLEYGAWIENNNLIININSELKMTIQKLALQGKHNIYNSMAAGVAGRILELRKEVIRESLSDFESLEHRLETIVKVSGVNYINDSKATNINSTWYALESIDTPIVLIMGGVDKGNDYGIIEDLVKDKVKGIICLGIDNNKIHEAFEGHVETMIDTQSMHEAVRFAYKMSEKGDTVILSPACASFDLFENYEERGRQFKTAVRGL